MPTPERWRAQNRYVRTAENVIVGREPLSVAAPRSSPRRTFWSPEAAAQDAYLQEALRRNLGFASLRISIQTGLRDEIRRALHAWFEAAGARALQQQLLDVAEHHLSVETLTRGLARMRSEAALMRLRWARALQHWRLASLVRGLVCWNTKLKVARRRAFERQRRKAQQEQTLVMLHARLLLWNWRRLHGAVRVALRGCAAAVQTARSSRALRLAWGTWMGFRALVARLEHHVGHVVERALRLAWGTWMDLRALEARLERRIGHVMERVRAKRLGRGLRRWRRAASARSVATARLRLALTHMRHAPLLWALRSWRREARLRLLMHVYKRRGVRRWAAATTLRRARHRLGTLAGRAWLSFRQRRVSDALDRWMSLARPFGQRNRLVRIALGRLMHRRQWMALSTWRVAVGLRRAAARRRQAAAKGQLAGLLRAWVRSGRDALERARLFTLSVHSARASLLDRSVRLSWGYWTRAIAPAAELQRRGRRFISMGRWRLVARAFHSWADEAYVDCHGWRV